MSAHMCEVLTPGCYRCDLNRDEIDHFRSERLDKVTAILSAYADDPTDAAVAVIDMLDAEGYL